MLWPSHHAFIKEFRSERGQKYICDSVMFQQKYCQVDIQCFKLNAKGKITNFLANNTNK